jgi:hypothetical protein
VAPGDRIIVDGVQKAGPGRTVHATPFTDSTTGGPTNGLTNGPTKGPTR